MADDYRNIYNDTSAPLGTLAVGTPATGNIEAAGDRDVFEISLIAGRQYTFVLNGTGGGGGTLPDSQLFLFDSSGNQIAFDEDGGPVYDSTITFFVPVGQGGTYYLAAGAYSSNTGTYTLEATVAPDTTILSPIGADETRVNQYVGGDQTRPHTASFADGSYIVAFRASNTEGASDQGGIYFQRYDASGNPVHADGVTAGADQVHVNTTTAGYQTYTKVTVLSDGKFVITWTDLNGNDSSGEGIYAQLFDTDGTALGGEILVNASTYDRQTQSTAVATADGGFIIAWASNSGADGNGYGSYGQRFDGSGNFVAWDGSANGNVRAETLVNTTTTGDNAWTTALALQGGKTMFIYSSRNGGSGGQDAVNNTDGATDVYGKIFNADGTVATAEFRINTYLPSEQLWPHATVLANGDVVVTWMSAGQDGSGYGIYGQILHPDGTMVGSEFRVNSYAGGDQENYEEGAGAHVTALSDGGFVVVWHSYQDSSSRGVYYQRYDEHGNKIGGEVQANQVEGGDQSFGDAVATNDGFTIVWDSENQASTGDTQGYGLVARHFALEPVIAATGGEDQVNTHTTYKQEYGQVASAADGSYVIVWQSQAAVGSGDAGDGDGWGIFGQRYNADGTRAGGEFRINTTTAGDQASADVVYLDGANAGKFVVTWTSPDSSGSGIYARVYNADGSAASGEFIVNANTGNDQGPSAIAALHGDNAGGFIITWSAWYDAGGGAVNDIFAQRFDDTFSAVGGEFRVTTNDGANASDDYETGPNVIGTPDGGYIIAWNDSASDGYWDGALAKRYDSNDVALPGTNPDGTTQTNAFRLNNFTTYSQDVNGFHHALGAFADGSFVAVWQSQYQDGSEWGVFAQIYNADGTILTPEFRINSAAYADQSDAQVAVLADGSFVVVWTSNQTNQGEGEEIYAKRFDAQGNVLNQEFVVNTVQTAGEQRWPSVAATPDGFVVTWTDQHESADKYAGGADGSSNGVFKQQFTIDQLNATAGNEGTAHKPSVVVEALTAHQVTTNPNVTDNAAALHIDVTPDAAAAGTESMSVEIGGIPAGATLSDGTNSFTATVFQTAISVDGWNLSTLTITPALESEASFTLTFRATSTDSVTHDTETTTAEIPVTIAPVALPQALDGSAERVNSNVVGNQMFDAGASENPLATWADGSYVIVWTSTSGQDGSGNGVHAQKFDADGNPVGGEIQVNTTTLDSQASPSVAALADGSFVVTWESNNQAATQQGGGSSYYDIYARTFDSTGAGGAEVHVNSFTSWYTQQSEPSITVLADGGYLIAWQSAGQEDGSWGAYAQRFDAAGNMVSRDGATVGADEIHLNTTTTADQYQPVTAALQDGGWLAVWHSNGQDGSGLGVYAQRFDASGNMVHADGSTLSGGETGAEFLVNTTTVGHQQEPAVVTLADGGWVIAWQDDRTDGSSWGVYAQVFNSDGSARGGEFLVNTYTGGDQSQVTLAATPTGGFFAAYHDQHDRDNYGIYGQQFDAHGQKVGQEILLNKEFQLGIQSFPHIAATPDGIVAAWQSNYYYGPANEAGNDSPNSWGIFAKRISLSVDHIAPTGGENQVNSTTPHEQQSSAAATLGNGDYVILWNSRPSQSSAADHDISDWGVYGQLYHADGTRVGGEFVVNSNTDGDQSQPAATALDNGGFVVVWQSATGDGSGFGIYGQRFDDSGNAVGSEFLVNSGTSGNQYHASVEALHGANAGGFVVTWDNDDDTVSARVFDATGAGTPVAVGSDVTVNVQQPTLNGGNSAEHLARVAAGADGGFTIVWQDDSTDGSGSGIFAQRFTADLITGAVTAAGTQPDGTAAASNFRVNHDTYSGQYNPDIAALAGGGFVAVWQSDVGDDGGSGIRAQFYNADGTLNGTEFQINTGTVGSQYEPRVLALSDGTFVVAWRSNETGSNGYDIYANHFNASGQVLDDQFRVNATTAGDQSQIALAESENGFVISWTSPDQDGSSTGVFAQRFVIDPGPSGAERAIDPTLTVSASGGDQDTAIALHIDASLNDSNGATPETLSIEISNIPEGAVIADNAGHTFTSDARASAVDVAGWDLGTLTITPPAGSTSAIDLIVRATATEADGDFASVATTAHVTVDVVVPPQAPYNVEFVVDTATGRSDPLPQVASFADGSFVEVWQTNTAGVGHGIDLMARLYNADGTPQGDAFLVNPTGSDTPYYNSNATVAVLADGTFAIAWQASGISGDSGDEIRVQRFSSAGDKLLPDGTVGEMALRLSTGTDGAGNDAHSNTQSNPQMTALADGSYIVVWMSAYEDGGTGTWGIYATRIDASGNVVPMIDDNGATADVIHVSDTVDGDQNYPSVVELADGKLVVGYDSPDVSGQGAFYRIYDSATGFGAETQINGYNTNSQSSFYHGGTLAALGDGGFVAVWGSDSQDGSTWGIYGQVFNADGTVRHAEFQVSSYALNQQQEPQITSLPDGGFMVVWTSNGQDGDSWGVYGQRFDAAGDRVGTEFRLNTTISADQSTPDIAVQGDGSGVIVTWEDNSGGNKVVSERIPLPDASTPQAIETAGAAQQVNVTTNDQQTNAAVVKLGDGTYVVAWQSLNQDGSGWGVYARHYDAAGHSIQWAGGIDELQLSTQTVSSQYNVKLAALADGSFMAGWQDDGSHGGGSGNDVFVRHFSPDGIALALNDSTGAPTTAEVRVNTTVASTQSNIELTALTNGSVAVTWASDNGDGSGWGVYGKQLTVVGGTLQLSASADALINTHVAGNQYGDDHQGYTAALTNGEYVVVWQSDSNSDGSGWGIYGQIMNADGTAHGSEFLINTETASNQVRASVAALSNGGFVVVWDGDSTDGNALGIAGQLYDAAGNPVGSQFQIDAVAQNSQYNAWVEGTQDGGFVVAWRSDSFDGSGSGIALRRFDSSGHATDPYGDDVLVNVSYSLNDQDRPAIATLDNGIVVVWQSANQDGSSWGIEQQRFQGAGLEPPPLTVDKNALANGTTIFNTIQDAVGAAQSGDIIEIVGGADAAHAVTFDESVTVATTGLTIRNKANTFVVVQGDDGSAALDVASGDAITVKGDAAERLVLNAGANAGSAIHLGGSNDGSVVQRVTVNAGDDGTGGTGAGSALLIEGGQNGILVQFADFGGHTSGVLASVLGASTGAAASTGVSFVSNTFTLNGGSGLSLDATGSNVKSNAFSGTGSESGGALVLNASGDDVVQNTFGSAGTPHILDPNSLYVESTLISQNSFTVPWVWDHQRDGVFSTVGEALAVAQAGDTLQTSGGSFAFEATPTIAVDNLTINTSASENGITVDLGAGVTHLTLTGSGGMVVNGNDEGDTILANDGTVTLNGGAGGDTLTGGYGATTLNGGGGTDQITIQLTGGVDTVNAGGDDDDTVVVNSAPIGGAAATISESGGTVTVDVGGVTHAVIDGAEVITYNAAYSNDLTITGFAVNGTSPADSMRVNFVGDGGANSVDASGLTGVATINSSAGDDTYIGGPAGVFELVYTDGGVGTGVVVNVSGVAQTVGALTVASGTAHDEFGNTDSLSMAGVLSLFTGAGNDSIWGGAEVDIFSTGDGNDVVRGGGGGDLFTGGAGTKDWYGEQGDDSYYVTSATMVVHENASEGTDTVVTDLASYTLTAEVEKLTGTSSAGQTLHGNGLDNLITTDQLGTGDDTVNAGDGDDTIAIFDGNDTVDGGIGNDTVDYSGFSTVFGGIDADLSTGSVDKILFTDSLSNVENLIGSGAADSLAGDGTANVLTGGDGDDVLLGRGGDDTLAGGAGTDMVEYLASPADGLLQRDGSGGYTFNGGAAEGTDTLSGVEMFLFAGADGTFSTADDRLFQIGGGNVALQVAADTGSATEAGGLNNATAAANATGNVLANDINLDEDATAGDTQHVSTIVWTGATGPGTGSGTTTGTAVTAGGVTIQGRYGSLTISASGAYTYTPDATKADLIPAGTTATETFTYAAGDGIAADASTTLTISLAGRNDTPIASDVSTSGGEDAGTIAGTLSASDVDQGAALTFALVAGSVKVNGATVADGTVTVNSNGSYSYATGAADNALNAGESRTITFSYTANDGSATSPAKTATITVNGANDAPTAVADTSSTAENTSKTVDVLGNDTDPDTTHVFTLVSVTGPANKGTVNVVSDQVQFDPGTDFDHLAQGAHEDVVINYTMQDDHGVTSSSTLTLTVNGVNDAPTSADATASGAENDASIGGTLTASDVDDGAALTFGLVPGSVKVNGSAAADGTVTVNADGSYSYTPGAADNALNVGEQRTITFDFSVTDGIAAIQKSVTITVDGANDAPMANADTSSTTENAAKTVNVLANDSDADTSHVFTLVSATGSANKGTVSVVGNQVQFDPGTDFDHLAQGGHEDVVINYTMRDDNGVTSSSTLTLTVNGANDTPTSSNASASGSEDDASIGGTLTASDVDDGASLTFGLVAGSVKIDGATAADGTVIVNSDGTYSYAPGAADNALNAGEHRTITFDFNVTDGIATIQKSATITVNGANDAPTAVADTSNTAENTAKTVDVLANDSDRDASHVFTLVSATGPANKGTVSVVGNQVQFDPGTDFDHLAAGAHEDVVINYTMRDDNGVTSSSTLTLTVNGANDAPTSANATATGTEDDTSIGGMLTAGDIDDGAALTFSLVAGSVKIDGVTVADGTVTVNSDGSYSYAPGAGDDALNVGEHRTVTFDFSVTDGIATIQKSATITVNGANDVPTANADTGTTGENAAANFDVLANDSDPDTSHVLTLDSATAPVGKGTASIVGNQLHFDPGTDFDHLAIGAHEDVVVSYQMEDDNGATSTSTITVTVTGANDAPIATADTNSVLENGSVSGGRRATGVLGNDTDADDNETATLTVVGGHFGSAADTAVTSSGSTVLKGTYGILYLNASGTYTYAATQFGAEALGAGQTGTDTFHYTVADVNGATSASTITFTVTGVDDAAVAKDDAVTTAENAVTNGSLFADNGSGVDRDIDGPALSIASVNGDAGNVGTQITLASGALLTVNADGSYSYDPNGQFDALAAYGSGASNTTGADSFTYTLANGNTATVTVSIHGVASTGDRMDGTGGNDTITGTPMDDVFMLQDGGQDSATGGDGNDGFYLGGDLGADDSFDGGAGSNDQVGLQGDYSGGLTLGAGNLVNTEVLVLMSGSDTRYGDTAGNLYSYDLTTVDENVGAGQRLAVSWNMLLAGENVTFDGSAETDGSFLTYGGQGNDTITGGQQDDGFYFGYGAWGAGDSVDGQGGALDQLGLQGDYSAAGTGGIVFGANQLVGVELIVCITSDDVRFGAAPGSGYSYELTMNDGNVASGETLYISANTLMAANGSTLLTGETLTFDGSAEADGNFTVYGGAGDDTIIGGAGDDHFWGGDGVDTLTGGGGSDTFAFVAVSNSTAASQDAITDFASGDVIDLSAIDAVPGTADDDLFSFVGANAFSNTAGELRYENLSGNDWLIQGDVDGDGVADLQIEVTITDGHTLGAGDFLL